MKSIFFQALVILVAFVMGLRLAWLNEGSTGGPEPEPITAVTQLVVPEEPSEAAFLIEAELEKKLAALVDTRSRVPEDFAGPFDGDRLSKLAKAVSKREINSQDLINYVNAWARHNPQQIWDYFLRRGSLSIREDRRGGSEITDVCDILFSSWLEQDARACLDAVMAAPLGFVSPAGLLRCVHTLWKSYPEETFALVVKSFEQKLNPRHDWFRADQLTEEAARAMFDRIQHLSPGDVRTRLSGAFWYSVKDSHSELSRTVWSGFSLSGKAAILEGGCLSTHDLPEVNVMLTALRQQVEAEPDPVDAINFLRRFGHYWVQRDLPGVVAWAAEYFQGRPGFDMWLVCYGKALVLNRRQPPQPYPSFPMARGVIMFWPKHPRFLGWVVMLRLALIFTKPCLLRTARGCAKKRSKGRRESASFQHQEFAGVKQHAAHGRQPLLFEQRLAHVQFCFRRRPLENKRKGTL